LIENILFESGLLKLILSLPSDTDSFSLTVKDGKIKEGSFSFMIEISNLIKTLCKSDLDLQAMLDSIPEWKSFEDGMLQTINEVLTTPLVKDPKTKIESLFDDNNEFKFTGFKPVP
jgi:hypothetical protein